MNEEIDPQDEIDAAALLRDLKTIRENRCAGCGAAICGHEALMSLMMGFKDAPRCWPCLSAALDHDREALRDHLFAVIARRSCYSAGWLWANQEEGFLPEVCPECLWPAQSTTQSSEPRTLSPAVQDRTLMHDGNSTCDVEWDAGDMGCGDLVLELRIRSQSLKPGQVLKVVAMDQGAQVDLPAWCRMTGNTLLASQHPVYLIKKTP